MDRRTFLETAGSAVVVAGLAGCEAAPGAGDVTERPAPTPSATPATTDTGTPTGGGGQTVAMVSDGSEFYFDPIGLFVEPGTTVTWEIESGLHSTVAYQEGNGPASVTRIPDGADAWASGNLSEQGDTFEHEFTTEGTYDYFCTPHKSLGMVGRVVVGQPGGPAEGSMPPDGSVPDSGTIVDQGAVSYDEFSG